MHLEAAVGSSSTPARAPPSSPPEAPDTPDVPSETVHSPAAMVRRPARPSTPLYFNPNRDERPPHAAQEEKAAASSQEDEAAAAAAAAQEDEDAELFEALRLSKAQFEMEEAARQQQSELVVEDDHKDMARAISDSLKVKTAQELEIAELAQAIALSLTMEDELKMIAEALGEAAPQQDKQAQAKELPPLLVRPTRLKPLSPEEAAALPAPVVPQAGPRACPTPQMDAVPLTRLRLSRSRPPPRPPSTSRRGRRRRS